MWRVVVAMEQRDPTYHAFGPGYSKNKDRCERKYFRRYIDDEAEEDDDDAE